MTDSCDKGNVLRLLNRARQLPHGPAKVACIERAAQIADAIGDPPLAFLAREGLIEAAEFSGSPEKTLSAFAWCLAQCDRDPRHFPISRILWQYKWAADNLHVFPNMSRAEIARTLDDVEDRFRANGWGLRGPRKLRLVVAMAMGERDAAREYYRAWSATRRDTGSDCTACDYQAKTRYFQLMGDHARAICAAEPLLEGGLTCSEEPHHTTCLAIRSLLRLNRMDEAIECYHQTRRRLRPTSALLTEVGIHIEFLVLTANLRRAVTLFERHTPTALATWDFEMKFEFLVSSLLLFRSLERQGRGPMRLRTAASVPILRSEGKLSPGDVASWLAGECTAVAAAFDRRNRNNFYSTRVEAVDELLSEQRGVELS